MNQELIMMFNGDEAVRLNADAGNEVTADGMIAALYNEMQQSIQAESETRQIVVVDEAQNIVTSNFGSFKDVDNFKVIDSSSLITEDIPPPTDGTSNGVNEDNLLLMDDGVTVSLSDENPHKSKNIEIPDTWKIGILESNGIIPHNAEPLLENEKQTYQLWECPKCTALFRDKDTCELHVVKSHDFSCGLCSEPFQEKEELENHIIQHISEIPGHALQMVVRSNEKENNVGIQTLDELAVENATNIAAAPNISDSRIQKSVEVPISESSVEENASEIFICSSCGLSFSSKQHLEEHEETHMDEDSSVHSHEVSIPVIDTVSAEESESSSKGHQQFSCDVCEKVCFTKNSLLLHMNKRHCTTKKSTYTCEECGQGFKWKLSLENHLVIQHNHKKKSFPCSMCEEVCSSSEALLKHTQSHGPENCPFGCDTCGARFKHSANLLNHIKINHPNGEKFSCDECGKSFKIKKFLEAHISEVHGQKGSNKCKYCLKSFMSTDSLINHIRTHHTSKQDKHYNCKICNCSFVSSRDLYQHMAVHVAEAKNLECHVCGKIFNREDTLNMHLKTHADSTHLVANET